ncbi:type III glutamate--ammonia ligase [soil metagenome]
MPDVTQAALDRFEGRLDEWESRGIWIIFHDYSGRSCAKWIPRPSVRPALERGGVFARANLNFTIDDHQVSHPHFGADSGDFFAVPDHDTLVTVPYHPGTARVHSWMRTEEGEPWDGCPRTRLANQLDRLRERGLSARVAFEPEFSLYRRGPDGSPEPVDQHAMYSVDRINDQFELLKRIGETLTEQDVEIIQFGAEYGKGQVEINLAHQSPLKAADDLLIFRDTVRAPAREDGLIATFMPKPYAAAAGNGLHVHLSLWDADGNEDRSTGDGPLGLSTDMGHFIGGVLEHAPAICGVAAPTVNSYKRLQPASWAPAHIAYAAGNRSALVRVPGSTRRRLEFRSGDCTSNPYLLLTALIAAGIDGLDNDTNPGEPAGADLGHAAGEALEAEGIRFLPRTAGDALDAVEASETVMDALGPVCGPELLRVKRFELARYDVEVGDWERDVYLERV